MQRNHECLDCRTTWTADVQFSEYSHNLSGEKTAFCPKCNGRNVSSSPAFDPEPLTQGNRTMTTTTYNGFANYQTWAYRLWMMNEQESYETALNMARAAIANASHERETDDLSDEQAAQFELEDMLKQQCEENMPELEACVWSDLLRSAVDDINWGEIAKGLIEDVTA